MPTEIAQLKYGFGSIIIQYADVFVEGVASLGLISKCVDYNENRWFKFATLWTPFVLQISETNGNIVTAVDEKVGQINEIDTSNKMLRRKLHKDDQLNDILAQHAKDLQKAQNSCTQLHQLNKQLETNLSMSETRLSELQKQYNEVLASAASAESQLKDAIQDVGKHITFVFCFWNFLIFAMGKSVTVSWISRR